ncbi:MAG TPA: NPCBM/NEW2 domain-containing protein [Anaerohalosphaeraceae bacterium]|nr:NPCBM/NEW2 domain-containing protein [Anaerohalosphaeraceae bacterium]
MNTHEKFNEDIHYLLIHLLENDLQDDQRERLVRWSRENPAAVEQYCAFLRDESILRRVLTSVADADYGVLLEAQPPFDAEIWNALLEDQETAETVKLSASEPASEPNSKQISPLQGKKTSSKLEIGILAAIAAMLFVLVSFYWLPSKTIVAEVADALDCTWGNGGVLLKVGDFFYNTDTPRFLKSGIVKIQFYHGASVILEGPCMFRCKSEGMLELQYGRALARVPEHASGFTVETPISRIVDIGTEFGVEVQPNSTCRTQVFEGKAKLISNLLHGEMISEMLEKGKARRVDERTRQIMEDHFDEYAYVRSFDSATNQVWRGEKLNLADIAGGGNGLGTGKINARLELFTEKPIPKKGTNLYVGEGFIPIAENPFVDGVFVPDGSEKAPVISTTGLVFEGCPPTSNSYSHAICNGLREDANFHLGIQGVRYGTAQNPAILMHSNAGITFDLEAIRRQFPHLNLYQFTFQVGIVDTVHAPGLGKADFYVLADGVLYYQKNGVQTGQLFDASVVLMGDCRFLTLVVTDSGPNEDGSQAVHNDWCLFANPYLHLKPKIQE